MAFTTAHQTQYFLPRRHRSANELARAARPAAVARARTAAANRAVTAVSFGMLQLVIVVVFATILLLGPAGLGPLG